MRLFDSLILPDAVGPPVYVENQQCKAKSILVGHLILPRLVLLRPGDVTIVDELRLVSLFELSFEQLLLGLDREILMEPAPVVPVVVIKSQQVGRPQHKSIQSRTPPPSLYQTSIAWLFFDDHAHTQSQILLRLLAVVWLRYDLQWLVDFHYRQNSQTSFAFLVQMSQAMNQNCFPNRRMAYQKMATSLGAHFQKTQVGVTGFMRMSRSRFLQRWLTVSRYSQIGFFFFSGLVLQISFWGWITWRIGCFFSRRSLTSWTQGWSQLWRLAFLMRQQSLSKFGQVDYSRFCFLWGSAITHPDFISIERQQTQTLFFIPPNTNTSLQLIVSHRYFYIIDSEMYELSDRNNSKFGEGLLAGEHDIVVQNSRRTCTDVLCLVLFLLFLFAFLGLLIFGLVKGNPDKVFNVYNAKQVQCYTQTATPYGFFPVLGSISNATCVSQCPTSQQMTVTCLPDSVACTTGTITASYPTLTLNNYCVPTGTTNYQDISQIVNTNIFRAWALDLSQGWMVLVGAGVAAMLASMVFLIFVRCCTGIVIWITIFVCICGMEVIGVFFILEAKGVKISSFVSDSLSSMTYNSLIIIGSGMIVAGVLLAIITICLRSRIALGTKSVQLGAMFLLENCGVILLPITQALFILAGIAAIIVGGSYLYSLGTFTFPDNSAFPAIQLPPEIIVIMVVYLLGGFWLVFFFHGCNHFIICSAASIWYFNHESPHDLGAPFGDSLYRLLRFHPGSVAITSLINGVFYIVKILAHILSFEAGKDDHGCTLVCMKILSFIFCIFQCFLRFLNDGTYVQIAVTGRGYCHSAFKAFGVISDNITKISLTDGISMFFTVLGVLGIGIGVTVAAYFSCIEIQYLAKLLTNPLIVTLVSGLIGFVVAGIYLSMIDLSAQSIIQCYFIDHEFCNGYPRYARPQFKEIILIEP